jgi:dihydrofolate reductase
MVNYELIVAMNEDGIIGITDASGNQRIPGWSSTIGSVDMRHFRETTTSPEGHILVIGRKTFESLPKRPLPGRIHVVLSRTPSKYDERYTNTNDVYFTRLENLDEVLEPLVYPYSNRRVFVCGGEEIYRALLPRCERLHVTHIRVPIILEEGETVSRFPSLDSNEFRETGSAEKGRCAFKIYERRFCDPDV